MATDIRLNGGVDEGRTESLPCSIRHSPGTTATLSIPSWGSAGVSDGIDEELAGQPRARDGALRPNLAVAPRCCLSPR